MKHDVKYQELNDEQLEQVVGGQGPFNVTIPQTNANVTTQRATAAAVGIGGNATATAANFNAALQSNRLG